MASLGIYSVDTEIIPTIALENAGTYVQTCKSSIQITQRCPPTAMSVDAHHMVGNKYHMLEYNQYHVCNIQSPDSSRME